MPNYVERNQSIFPPRLRANLRELAKLRKRNNPLDEPVGGHTGLYANCGSNALWEDNVAHGRDSCAELPCGN